MSSPKMIAEEVLRIYNGGMMRTDNSQWDLRMVQLLVRQARDRAVKDKVLSDTSGGKPLEDAMFTRFENLTTQFDSSSLSIYLDLPMGYMTLPDDRGIRVLPVEGFDSMFRRAPSGAMFSSNRLWAEGNVLWMTRPPKNGGGNRRLIFMNAPSNEFNLTLEVIIGESERYQNDEVGIPDGMELLVIDLVLEKMGVRRQPADTVNDKRDQA